MPLANENFAAVESESTLQVLHDYLLTKCNLFDRVIRARKIHHKHFFSSSLDYCHQHYIDTLSNKRFIAIRALERLERRIGDVLHRKRKWFKWVRQCQDDEEAHRENEKKKIKLEASLFKRHTKEVQLRLSELKAKENIKRQVAFLDQAHRERLESEADESEWDPIEEVIENQRGNYIDLIRHILLLTESVDAPETSKDAGTPETSANGTNQQQSVAGSTEPKMNKKERKQKLKTEEKEIEASIPDKSAHDTKSQVRQRLKEGIELAWAPGSQISGTIENPIQLKDKTASFSEEEVDRLLDEMAGVKHLLFCRLLLSHATLLPIALKADSIDEVLNDEDVSEVDLRDLCLKLDDPGLQAIRDACADLGRRDEDSPDEDDQAHEDDSDSERDFRKRQNRHGLGMFRRKELKAWAPKREKEIESGTRKRQSLVEQTRGIPGLQTAGVEPTMIDFGDVDDKGDFKSRKIRVKVCGRYIYNYPSESAVTRSGWLHFCLIAKDSDLHDAIKLCRNWNEF